MTTAGKAIQVGLALLTLVALAGGCGQLRERRQATPTALAPVPTFTPTPVPAAAAMQDAVAPDVSAEAGDAGTQPFVELVAADADVFNPVLTNSSTSAAVLDMIYPRLVNQDAQTGVITAGEVATDWDISADGRTYTFTLRSDVSWSDGQPVTAADFRFTYDALAAVEAASPAADRLNGIDEIETPDPNTIILRLDQADCSVLQRLRLPWLPSHRYAADYADLAANPLNQQPVVSAGPFRFAEWTPKGQIVLEANPDYWNGAPAIDRYIVRIEPDASERLRLMANGEADLTRLPATELAAAEGLAGAGVHRHPARSIEYLALNWADAQNPQPGQDAGGALFPQQPHAILGEAAVRRAIALGVDAERIRTQAYGTAGFAPVSAVPPSVTWAHAHDLSPYKYAPEAAIGALETAGWIDADGDGVRERNGVRLALSLVTNEENAARGGAADLIAAQLGEIGFEIAVQRAPFDEVAAQVLAQRFDLALLGWENLPADPGLLPLWHSEDDAPGACVNFTSFQDAEVDAWLDSAQVAPGCDLAVRGDLYRRVQGRVHESLPVLFLHGDTDTWLFSERWTGVEPGAFGHGDLSAWRPAD